MRFRFTHLAILLSALSLAACGTVAPHVYLPDPARDKIVSTEVVNSIRQNEIYVYVPPSSGGATAGAASSGGGIRPALLHLK